MKLARKNCIDCGSEAVKSIVDEVRPVYKMEIINFACGAVSRTFLPLTAMSVRYLIQGVGMKNYYPLYKYDQVALHSTFY